MMLGQGGTVIQ